MRSAKRTSKRNVRLLEAPEQRKEGEGAAAVCTATHELVNLDDVVIWTGGGEYLWDGEQFTPLQEPQLRRWCDLESK
jgi:hypothetical protein